MMLSLRRTLVLKNRDQLLNHELNHYQKKLNKEMKVQVSDTTKMPQGYIAETHK